MDKKRPNLQFAIQIFLLICIVISGLATLLSSKWGASMFGYVCMWFVAIIQTLALITDAHQIINKGEDESGEDTDKEE